MQLNYLDQNNEPPVYVRNVAESYNFDNLSDKEQLELIDLLELQAADGLDNISLYGWQKKYNSATKSHRQCLLMAANRVGKTYTGCYIDAIHATGRYPDDWDGYKFDHAPLIWCLGYSGEKIRDILQSALFGAYSNGDFSGGLISKEYILGAISSAGTSKLASEVRVKWVGPNGEEGISVVQFKSYSQGQHALMGDDIDWYHIDEEPKDDKIWPQVLTRTASGDKGRGGRGILTFTPENGKTELVTKFMDDTGPGQYLQTATWDDAPHLNEEIKEEILSAYPAYQRDMRSKGTPLMGSGLIYPIDEDLIKCDPFDIPSYWFVINGMDFGWDHPQAHVQLVWDRDADIYYIVNAWKGSKKQPFEAWHIVKPWAENCPTAWPHDGLQTEKGSAKQQKSYYLEEGFDLLPEHATWEDGGNGVWAGIMELNNLMSTGRLKVVSTLFEFFEELRQYHTKTTPSGKSEIVKVKDDLLDACFHADTKVITKDGTHKIVDLVGTTGEVMSVGGEWQKYSMCELTRRDAELITLTFSDGHKVTCTPDHKYLTCNGWIEAIHLHDEDIITSWSQNWKSTYISTIRDTQSLAGITGMIRSCIGTYGQARMEKSQTGITSITSMAIKPITILKTLNAYLALSTCLIMLGCAKCFLIAACSVVTNFIAGILAPQNSVAINANLNTGDYLELMTKSDYVQDAELAIKKTSTPKSSIAEKAVKGRIGSNRQKVEGTLRVLRIESATPNDVYCMSVENTQALALANGVIAHNCRYAYMMRRYAIRVCDLHPEQAYNAPNQANDGRDSITGY